jgi:CO/xanthine dehydrogenase FAD-binding subunit
MILPRFELLEPTSVKVVCDILQRNNDTRVIAGGTDLLVNMKKKVIMAGTLVSLDKISELKDVSYSGKTGLTMGSMVRIADVAESPIIKTNYTILATAAGKLGSLQIRNRATIGGNICSARPAADTIGPLIAYGAVARIASPDGAREEAIETIFKGPGQTTIRKGEFLTAITIKSPEENTVSSYIKFGVRRAMDIAVVSVTSLITLKNGTCSLARLVLGAVAPTFIRCLKAEEFLLGKDLSEDVAEQASQLATEASRPISDFRASADYRRHLVQVLVKRSLLETASNQVN